jgi:catechol 2,3-dioxygenase-like lactoylglutathione lyase family enzyme
MFHMISQRVIATASLQHSKDSRRPLASRGTKAVPTYHASHQASPHTIEPPPVRRQAFSMTALLINIDVPELERGIAFYTAAFGLRLSRRLGPDFAELLGAEVPIYLILSAAGSPPFREAKLRRDYARHWTPLHLDFVVQDIDAALARALAAGATQESELGEHAYGRLVLLSDPFGHGECLLQFNARGYDAIESDAR